MTTIQIDEKTADGLTNQAKAHGMTLQEYLRALAANGSHSTSAPGDLPYEQWSTKLQAWAAGFPALPQVVDDSRESIYSGRGE